MNFIYQKVYHDEVNIFGILKDCVWLVLKSMLYGLVVVVVGLLLFGYKPYLVISGSMTPTYLENRDIVLVQEIDFQDIEVGDVITFKVGDACTHRVYELIQDNGVTTAIKTRGDAAAYNDPNADPDPWTLYEDDIIGKVVAAYKDVGAVYLYVTDNLYLCIAMVLMLYMGTVLLEKEKEYEKKPVIGA